MNILDNGLKIHNEIETIDQDWDDHQDIMPDGRYGLPRGELPDMVMSLLVFPHGHKKKSPRAE